MTDPNYPPPGYNYPPGTPAGGQPGVPPGSQPGMPPGGQPGYPPPAMPAGVPGGQAGVEPQQSAHGAPPAQGTPAKQKRAVPVGQILGAILFILVVVFIVENSQHVRIRIIIPVVHAPLYVAILIAAVLGALIAGLLRYRRRVGARRKAMVREHKAENRPD